MSEAFNTISSFRYVVNASEIRHTLPYDLLLLSVDTMHSVSNNPAFASHIISHGHSVLLPPLETFESQHLSFSSDSFI